MKEKFILKPSFLLRILLSCRCTFTNTVSSIAVSFCSSVHSSVVVLFSVAILSSGCDTSESDDGRKASSPSDSGVISNQSAVEDAPKDPIRERQVRTHQELTEADRSFAKALTSHRTKTFKGDLDAIRKRKVLRVLTRNNSTSYFLYRGKEAGFHFELAKMFAEELGVRLEMVVPPATRDLVPWLLEGRADIVMAALDTHAPRIGRVQLTRHYLESPLVVVVQKKDPVQYDSLESLSKLTLLVRPSSSSVKRIRALSKTITSGLPMRAARESLEAEDLIGEVADGNVSAAVVEKRVADVELLYRDDVRIAYVFEGEPVQSAFATRKEDKKLSAFADDFLRRHYRKKLFNIFYKRFHESRPRAARVRAESARADKNGQLTPWDAIFRREAVKVGLDWRLLVAQCFQESRFDPHAHSPYGAVGLMQMLPTTAAEVGIQNPEDPEASIVGGTRYLKKLVDRYLKKDLPLKEAVRFALAAYNVGPGHVDDARILGVKMGKDPKRWFGHVSEMLPLLARPRHFRAARFGYCRGEEPQRYVSEIQTRYDAYVGLTDQASFQP
ncbi:MAG: transglycosylase SLT domain-containing protein [Deltaproteobacteria bacterium]|nr:transglycosylase SLT domain-containing protein [Deltaproteobacteria bacterium]